VFFAYSGSQLGGKHCAKEVVEMEVRKWLRQQAKYFYAACFHALVKQWNKYITMLLEDISRNTFFF
jgi:hypothetical protein